MNANDAKEMVSKFIKKAGVEIQWRKSVTTLNSRGVPVTHPGDELVTERVLLLKEKFNPLHSTDAPIGMALDTARYIICLPDTPLVKDDIVTDSHGNSWRLDVLDWFDVSGVPVCKQAPVMRVDSVALKEAETKTEPELTGTVIIVGDLIEGEILSADISDIKGSKETDFTYQWNHAMLVDENSYNAIKGANNKTYTLKADDVGKYISVEIRAVGHSFYSFSGNKGPVEAANSTVIGTGNQNE